MLLVCQQTFNWSSLRLFGKIPKLDTAIIVLVSWITVVEDLAQAVVAGTIMSALSFAWKQSTQIFCSSNVNEKGWKEVRSCETKCSSRFRRYIILTSYCKERSDE